MAEKDIMTLEDFFGKLENEGGLEGAFSWGLNPSKHLSQEDLAKFPEFAKLWKTASESYDALNEYINENFENIRYG
jgi:ABC-type Zn uptake system ZnuABC Zn-binding protein ZnuA